jgi:iron complex outermembrane receptor protein
MAARLTGLAIARRIFLVTTTLTAAAPMVASGQEATPEQAQTSGDIIVTALRRDERLQDAPASITAISGETLTKLGAKDFNDYYRSVPSLQITSNPITPGASRISIRGVYAAGESTAGLYYGDTPVTGPAGNLADPGAQLPNLNLFDVERVEVLRGPQGTLYGAGSVGGTIRVIFAKPNATKFEGHIEAQGSTTEHGGEGGSLRGAINIPIATDVLALRVVGFTERTAGYVDNIRFNTKDINESTASGGRAILAFTPTDNFEVTGTAMYQESHYNNNSTWFQQYGRKSYETDSPINVPYDDKMRLFSATANWTTPFVKLTGTVSHYRWNIVREGDATVGLYPSIVSAGTSSPLCSIYNQLSGPCSADQLANYKSYAFGTLPASYHSPMVLKVDTQEFRIASVAKTWFDWTVGIFHEKRFDTIDSYLAKVDASTGDLLDPLLSNSYRIVSTDFSQFSQFAEVSVRPIEGLTLTGGARHYEFKKEVSGQVIQTGIVIGSFAGPLTGVSQSESGWVGKAAISYKFNDQVLAYAQWAQGFRPGGANNIPTANQSLVTYGSDALDSYEAGLKTTLLGGKATFNIALFQIEWSNMQSVAFVPPAYRIITNSGDSRIRGVEVEATAQPIPGLQFNAGFSYLPTAKLITAQAADGISQTGQNGLVGDRLPYTAKFTSNFSADYSWALTKNLEAFVRADINYHGKSANEFRPTFVNYERLPGFAEVNAKMGIDTERWGAFLFVNNVTGTLGAVAVQSLSTVSPYQAERILGTIRPRSYGINVSAKF